MKFCVLGSTVLFLTSLAALAADDDDFADLSPVMATLCPAGLECGQ